MNKKETIDNIKQLVGTEFYGNVALRLKRFKHKDLKTLLALIKGIDKVPMSELSLIISILILRIENHYDIKLSDFTKAKAKQIKRIK